MGDAERLCTQEPLGSGPCSVSGDYNFGKDCKRSNQPILKEINRQYWKDWYWKRNTLATWCEEPTHWKRPWYWEGWRAGGEGGNKGWDGWMASPTQWAWVEQTPGGGWWRTGKPGVLRSMGLQRVGHDLMTKQQQHATKHTSQLKVSAKSWRAGVSINAFSALLGLRRWKKLGS